MRQWQPDGAQLQKARGARVEHAAGDVDVRHRVAIEQNLTTPEIEQEGKNRNAGDEPGQQGGFAVPAPDQRSAHSRWVSSRKIRKRASISSRVSNCRRSVPKRSTANDPITPP